MEKFSKFDDPSCGLNPFIPLQKTLTKKDEMNACQEYARWLFKFVLLALRIPCIVIALGMWFTLHFWKFFAVIPGLIRFFERLIDKMVGQLLLNVTSFNNI